MNNSATHLRCLYTYAPLNTNDPPDDSSATVEHIIPYALGGSDQFSIIYCSKKANNDLGTTIDSPFLELPIVGFKRHMLGLKSYSGKVPALRFKGECVELNRACHVIFPYEGMPYADFGMEVKGALADAQMMKFRGGRERLERSIKDVIRKSSEKGLTIWSKDQNVIDSIDDAFAASRIDTGETLHFRINYGWDAFYVPWSKGILKIVLGLGALALGPTWAFSCEADKIRTSRLSSNSAFPNADIKGSTTAKIQPEIRQLLQMKEGEHVLAVLPSPEGAMMAYVSLFGGELMDAIIHLGDGPADIKTVNGSLPSDWKCVFRINPSSRTLTTLTIAEIDNSLL